MAEVRILIADGSRMFAEALAMALWWSSDVEVIGEYPTSGPTAVDAAVRHRPGLVLVDYWIPEMDGPSVAATILHRSPGTKVIVLSLFQEPSQADHALAAGAVGYFGKDIRVDQLVQIIREAAKGLAGVQLQGQAKAAAGKLAKKKDLAADLRQRLASLTPREMEVLRLLAKGRSVQEIARGLGMTASTVRVHSLNIATKAKVRTKEEAAAMARFCGLVS